MDVRADDDVSDSRMFLSIGQESHCFTVNPSVTVDLVIFLQSLGQ